MATLLLGITLILWSLNLLGIAAISNVLIGIFALITGILFLVTGFGVTVPEFPYRRTPNA